VIHLRLVVPAGLVDGVLELLTAFPNVTNLIHLPNAARQPRGDLVLCDVPREDASVLIGELRAIGLEAQGAMAVATLETAISSAGREAVLAAPGYGADAVVWEEVEAKTSESSELSVTFLIFMVISMLIAGVGILTDSIILIIGAMAVGPEFGPIAGVCVAFVQRRLPLVRRSLRALAVSFPVGILLTLLGTLVARAAGAAPDELDAKSHPETLFISDPTTWSVVTALLAGVAGILSLTASKSTPLVGVLISVTTIPAAANIGVAAAYGNTGEWTGSLAQLAINLACLFATGIGTLLVQRSAFEQRRRRAETHRVVR
jgi:uncharacterized hydrophobic protein (TIGR00271 family)